MITELKEALTELVDIVENVSEQRRCPDLIDSFTTQPARKILASLESQEARLREWEVREKCNNPHIPIPSLKCLRCGDAGFITHPATFDDVMDFIEEKDENGISIRQPMIFSDGRELRKKG